MTIQRARDILEADGKKLTDEQVQEYINSAEVLSDMFFDMWFKMTPEERKKFDHKIKKKNKPLV